MRGLGRLLACSALIVSLASFGAAPALAGNSQNCSGSAGDSQYIDPLSCQTTSTPARSTPAPRSTTPSPPPQAPPPPATVSAVTTTATAAPDPHHAALPFTGLDIWPMLALGTGFIGAGVVLRRRVLSS